MVLSVFVADLYVFFRFLYVHVLQKEKIELFRPCQGYSSGGLWLPLTGLDLVLFLMSSGHFLRCVLNLKTLALTSALQSRQLTLVFWLNKSSIQDL